MFVAEMIVTERLLFQNLPALIHSHLLEPSRTPPFQGCCLLSNACAHSQRSANARRGWCDNDREPFGETAGGRIRIDSRCRRRITPSSIPETRPEQHPGLDLARLSFVSFREGERRWKGEGGVGGAQRASRVGLT